MLFLKGVVVTEKKLSGVELAQGLVVPRLTCVQHRPRGLALVRPPLSHTAGHDERRTLISCLR